MIENFNFSQPQWILGLMSGASLDGVDAALLKTDGIQITEYGPCDFLAYPKDFQTKLKTSCDTHKTDHTTVEGLTQYHIQAAQNLIKKSSFQPLAIGFHGQTIFHKPRINNQKAETLQIGNPQLMANVLNIPVIFDFRQNDINHGGEGAPLVPLFHAALMNTDKAAFVNIGGVSNITILKGNDLEAGDIGPGCALINDWIERHTNQTYDTDGKHALRGTVHQNIVAKWMMHDFFHQSLPKSLDRNTFRFVFKDVQNLNLEDGAATLTQFTVQAILHHTHDLNHLILCGGGRHNQYITNALASAQKFPQNIDALGFDGDFIEAYAFAYLAARSIQGLSLSTPTTTGVKEPVSGGSLHYPQY